MLFLLYKEETEGLFDVVDGGGGDVDDDNVEEVGLAPFDNMELLRWNVAVIFASLLFVSFSLVIPVVSLLSIVAFV